MISMQQAQLYYKQTTNSADIAALCKNDLFFLLAYGLKRKDLENPWLYDRCREVQKNPDGYLDLWARGHYKSTIITFALTIQNLLNDPELTVGLFSHTRPVAKAFLRQIMRELETNQLLKELFPQVLWQNPRKEAPKWSEDDGIVLKRNSNPKEATVEAWGLVDGQPTGRHYQLRIYDDVVTRESVTTPEMIAKVTQAWEMSLNLGPTEGGRVRYIGTRYHAADTYKIIMDRGAAIPRTHPATDNGMPDGAPVLLSHEELAKKRRDMGPYVFGSQMLQNPLADAVQGFKREWLCFHGEKTPENWLSMNRYILIDPASEKKKNSDYTVMWVVGINDDGNYYILDGIRDRLNLTQKVDKLFSLHRKWQPMAVGYEKYGMQADIEHIKFVQGIENYRFPIINLGGSMPKFDRIRRLVPLFEQNRIWLPIKLIFVDYERKARDMVDEFINHEYLSFPVAGHDDMLDALARIVEPELNAQFPLIASNTPYAWQQHACQDYNPMEYEL